MLIYDVFQNISLFIAIQTVAKPSSDFPCQ
jgi:hypothetical protein